MQPTLLVGDVVVSRPISPTTPLRVGQIILEQDPDHVGWLRLHRLVHLAGNGDVVTKGDANAQPDSSRVPTSGVVGIAALHIPYLGVPAVWVQTRQGGDLAALAAAAAGNQSVRKNAWALNSKSMNPAGLLASRHPKLGADAG